MYIYIYVYIYMINMLYFTFILPYTQMFSLSGIGWCVALDRTKASSNSAGDPTTAFAQSLVLKGLHRFEDFVWPLPYRPLSMAEPKRCSAPEVCYVYIYIHTHIDSSHRKKYRKVDHHHQKSLFRLFRVYRGTTRYLRRLFRMCNRFSSTPWRVPPDRCSAAPKWERFGADGGWEFLTHGKSWGYQESGGISTGTYLEF